MNFLLSLLFVFSFASQEKFSPALQKTLSTDENADVIVYFDSSNELLKARSVLDRTSRVQMVFNHLQSQRDFSQQDVRAWLEKNGIEHRSYYVANAIHIPNTTLATLKKLAAFDSVKSMGLNVHSKLKLPKAESIDKGNARELENHLVALNVEKVWSDLGVRGKGIVVAGQDSGFMWDHVSIKRQYRGYSEKAVSHDYNWHDGIRDSTCSLGGKIPCDDHSHGTHTMGTMVGDDGKGNYYGPAPESQWMGCRNMKNGVGTVATYMECFDFFMAPFPIGGNAKENGKPEMAPHIVNNSWGCPKSEGCMGDEFRAVIDAYNAAGIMLVAAAGNSGPGCETVFSQPATYAGDILVVGAWNSYLSEIAYFSSKGPSTLTGNLAPNVVTRGVAVKSATNKGVNAYGEKSGTSMAAPQVAGVVALLWSHRPELIGRVADTIDIIQKSAKPTKAKRTCGGFPGGEVPNAVYGYGLVDAYATLTYTD